MTLDDQMLRYKRIQANSQNIRISIDKEIERSDLKNYNIAVGIVKEYGWPKISDIGKDGQNNLWLLIQHADHDVKFQNLALSKMKKLISSGEASGSNYAFLYDRVQCNLNYKQLYGTQVVWANDGIASAFRPIIKEHLVDKRRVKLELEPLSVYSLGYGFSYVPVQQEQAISNDMSDLARTKSLIDSARAFYELKEFQKVYDYYNTASTIQGGMSNKQNYVAALLFADIFNSTKEDQYKGIAIDFLYLNYLREALHVSKLEIENAFNKFDDDPRWMEMISKN